MARQSNNDATGYGLGNEDAPLFAPPPAPTDTYQKSTSTLAGEGAIRNAERNRRWIMALLKKLGPKCLFELSDLMAIEEHVISGRITELKRDALIRETGDRRRKPSTGQQCSVLAIAPAGEDYLINHRFTVPGEK